ncbi:efflux RND transporter permease subunit [Clostridium estertheticum]|uniref:efflux RND transporter permease subunit n=1 Tax=Clostridium estertheticum TaxID=238834 RepID=UPI001C0D16B1|nr:efflux RND transporter permease subunit [Clostridium estertheticum]MBU3202444.1 efflux RND transporter permease subunit [Clostridium estertheticum]WAG65474.1 efflux RND transporter permease subunit [Clostridium estertheticum]
MKITELCVKKPLAVLMVVLLTVGLGVMGYSSLGADLMPAVDVPVITITTTYPGAGTAEIETDVVKPVEDAVSGISGIDTISSGSSEGYGYTTIMFKMGNDMNTAFLDVQQALGDISNKLPTDATKPVIKKLDINATPIMMLSVSSSLPYSKLYDSADKIQKSLEKTDGVGNVSLEGAVKKQLIIKVNKTLLEQYGIAVNTITSKLQSDNLNIPAGQFKQEDSNQTIKVLGQFENIKDVQNLQIPMTNGGSIKLSEIADVKLDYPDATELVRLNGKNSIGIFVQKQSDSNIVITAKAVQKQLDVLKKTLPAGIKVAITSDSSTFINSSLKEVKYGLIEGIISTILVMFLFLRSIKASSIILVAIPTSLIATFFMMYVFHFTLNMLSLLALSLSIGILVDDSIVVLENIQRHLAMGKTVFRSVVDGREEIAMAAISITLCDIVVFGPIAFMSGMIGQFFKQFGLTVVFAALFSLIVSFTVTPMLASKLLKEKKNDDDNKNMKLKKKGFFDKFIISYKKFLLFSLDHRWKMVALVSSLLIISVALIPLKLINTELTPKTDQSQFTINMSLSPSSDVKLTDVKVKEVEAHLKSLKEVDNYFTIVGINNKESSAQINVNLYPKKQREKSQDQISSEMRAWSKTLTGVDISIGEASSSGSSKPIAISITGPNLDVLKQLGSEVQSSVQAVSGTTDVSNSNQANESQIAVKIDKIAAAQYGIKPSDISSALKATTEQGVSGGVFRENNDEYDVIVKLDKGQIVTKSDISTIKVANSSGQQIPIDLLAKVYMSDSPQQILRKNRDEMVTIYANNQGRPLGSVTTDIKEKINKITIPDGYELSYGGDQKSMADSFTSLIEAIVASIILVYMILVVLYESFLTPALRMLSLPCGLIGALIALAITGNSLNIMSMIGLIMLDGLAAKNGTLLIDYTLTLMKTGLSLREALVEAGLTRLRPILMTTITMVVGMLPSALATAEGSEYRVGMSVAIIGGMITSTILSPIIIPVVYTLIDDMKGFFDKKKRKSDKIDKGVTL